MQTQNSRIFKISHPNIELQSELSQGLGISRTLSQLLINRGINNNIEAKNFLKADLKSLLDPFDFSGMKKAVGLVQEAKKKKQKVMLFGDYDVDGITSIALLKSVLIKLGFNVSHYIPHRIKEGYGLNKQAVNFAKKQGIKLVITVDCGTNSPKEIKELKRSKIKVIVTDHHQPLGDKDLEADAVINPKLKKSGYAFKDLAGVGVAYKFCQALTGQELFEELDLVALGTIADVVPLRGENRIIVKEGLKQLSNNRRQGILALIENSRLRKKEMTVEFVSFILGPRINASGRMDTAETALKLMMTSDKDEADILAKTLESFNRQRQKIEEQIMSEAQDLISREINFKEHKVIVVAKEDWHHGVLGVVASKLADRFYRPTVVISMDKEVCKGSARSIKNFHLFDALTDCQQFLTTFGGHEHAAGLTISRNRIKHFRDRINTLASERLSLEDLFPKIEIDLELDFADLTTQIIEELKLLEPFGVGNPEPLFLTRNLKLKSEIAVMGRDTIKFWVTDGIYTYQALGFGMGRFKESFLQAEGFDLVYTPKIDNWQGRNQIILEIKDVSLR
ncbi:MAG: single-stranded-DNA-specific exonuclease RecJ [Candidatus Omnitrophota bacterium]|nr:MAG: single-stranded-DNA-specific exonuclease RecJ [Candidatus Omnitrophota bacterium]